MIAAKVKTKLILTVVVLTVLPLSASYFLINDVVSRALNLSFNPAVSKLIESHQESLKMLRGFDPKNAGKYKQEFEESRAIQTIYRDSEFMKHTLNKTLFLYYAFGLGVVLLLSLVGAFLLSRSISRAYTQTLQEAMRQKEKVQFLEEISQWQDVAKKLAHEIKGPLTPIEILVTNLPRAYEKQPPAQFREQLKETQKIVSEEIGHLRKMVSSFTAFSKLPAAQFEDVDLREFLTEYIGFYAHSWPNARLSLKPDVAANFNVRLDRGLFRQVLMNLVNNAIEANGGNQIDIALKLENDSKSVKLIVENTGKPIPKEMQQKIFQVYYSTKKGQDHMGLGLPIVRKIITEHGGDIECLDLPTGAGFLIDLPKEVNHA